MQPIRRALISVSDKTGVVDFARALADAGTEILSTGGTAKLLAESGITVTEVSTHTGFPEIMDGRVKTLHPKIHGGLLGRRGTDDAIMAQHEIAPIDLLAVNLYPFEQTVADPDCDLITAIENIDIGGPAMLRAAAKNHVAVTVVVDSNDYDRVLQDLNNNDGAVSDALRYELACKVYAHTSRYDAAIANYLGSQRDNSADTFPDAFALHVEKLEDLRYGENPHQQAALYGATNAPVGCITNARQLQGKALSYNNIADADAALECVNSFEEPACVIVKHANPCGVAIAEDIGVAYNYAYQTDSTSAFGGIIAFNRELDAATASKIIEQQFVEVLIAPSINEKALQVLSSKPNLRALASGKPADHAREEQHYQYIRGGLLVQDPDVLDLDESQLKTVSNATPDDDMQRDLRFAWKVAKFVKSNAIVYARNGRTLGIGAGQMSRIDSARIAILKAADAKLDLKGAVMASDAFFPFRDSVDNAAKAGIAAIIQPGGSMRDEEVIAAANENNIVMLFTGTRHFRH